MVPESQKQIEKQIGRNTLRVLEALSWVDDVVSRLTFPVWKRLLRIRGIDMYKVESLGEEQELVRRISPILDNAIGLRIAEGDFSEGLFTDRQWLPDARVLITKVPEGSAPEPVRHAWRGLQMDAFRLPPSTTEIDLVSREPLPNRNSVLYAVRLDEALGVLERKSPQAAKWFRENTPPALNSLTFRASEVKVVRKRQEKKP